MAFINALRFLSVYPGWKMFNTFYSFDALNEYSFLNQGAHKSLYAFSKLDVTNLVVNKVFHYLSPLIVCRGWGAGAFPS